MDKKPASASQHWVNAIRRTIKNYSEEYSEKYSDEYGANMSP